MTGPAVSRISDSFLVPIIPMNSTGMCCLPRGGVSRRTDSRTGPFDIRVLVLDFQEGFIRRPGPGVAVLRDREAEVAPQGRGVVLGPDQAAVLKDRDDVLPEPAPLARVVDEQADPVEGAAVKPRLDGVRDRLR